MRTLVKIPFEVLLMVYDTIDDVDDKINFDLAIHPEKSRYHAVKKVLSTLTLPIIGKYRHESESIYSIYFVGIPIPGTQKGYQVVKCEYGMKVNVYDSYIKLTRVYLKWHDQSDWEYLEYKYEDMDTQSGRTITDGPSITRDRLPLR